MELESGAAAALSLGFLLGLKHATDADHVVAVSTMVAELGSAWRGVWIGASWGLGHTTPLLALGIILLLIKEALVDRLQQVAPILEFGVGIMLVLLGFQVFWNLRRGRVHIHRHVHPGSSMHLHVHGTHVLGNEPPQTGGHGLFRVGKPEFRRKSYAIGIVHGFAGSAAMMLVLLPQIDSAWVGVGYLLLFGSGTIISMSMLTLAIGVPFAVSGRFQRLDRTVAKIAGTTSLLFGGALMSEIAFSVRLIPF